MHNVLSKEDQDFLAAKISSAARNLDHLYAATDKVLSFYLPLHKAKYRQYLGLRDLVQLSATSKKTSVPDYYGVVLNTLETDPAQAREAQLRYRKLAKQLHPDMNGSSELFHIAHTAYKARDLNLLDLLNKAVYKQIELDEVISLISSRIQAKISMLHSSPAFKLLKLDTAAGKNGIIPAAEAYAEAILDTLISNLGISLLNGDKKDAV